MRNMSCPNVAVYPAVIPASVCCLFAQDLEAWAGSDGGTSSLLVDQPWFLWLGKVALACILVGTGSAFLVTSFLCVWWRGVELTDDRLVRDERGKKVDSKKSKTMSTDEMMDDMTVTFREIAPPDPDAMRRAMQSDGDGSQKLVPTRTKRGLAVLFVLRCTLNFYTVFSSFQEAMETQNAGAHSDGSSKVNYIISRRVIAFMETLYVGFNLCQFLYGIIYLTKARYRKLEYKLHHKPLTPDSKHFDRTEDAHKYMVHLAKAGSFSMIKCLPSVPKISQLINWAKSEGKGQLALWAENGKTLRNTNPFRFFFRFWLSGPCVPSWPPSLMHWQWV
jgi:hypothetical protein